MKTFQEFINDYYLSEEKATRPLTPKTYQKVLDKSDTLDSRAKGAFNILQRTRDRSELLRLSSLVKSLRSRAKKLRSAAYNNQPNYQ